MAEERVTVRVEVEGAQEGARQVERLATSVSGSSDQFQRMAQTGQQTAQRLQGVASAVQTLTSAVGSRDRTAGLVSSVAGAVAQFAAMGSMLGPAGTVVGGLAGLAVGINGVVTSTNRMTSAVETAADRLRDATTEAGRYAAALALVRAENDSVARLAAGRAISGGGALTGMSADDARAEIYSREAEIRRLSEEYGSAEGSPRVRQLQAEVDRLRREVLGESAGGITVEEGTLEMVAPGDPRYGRTPGVGRGGGRRRNPEMEAWEASMASMREDAAYEEQIWAETMASINSDVEDSLAERTRLREEAAERDAEIADAEFERQREVNEALADAERDHQERIAEGRLAMKDAQTELDQRQLQQREDTLGEYMSLAGQATSAFGKTLASIAMGEKSADEAFKGLAASFLEMISQYASLKAGVEFADAAASFARYDFSGGAAHIGAGLAFTAVAVATGVGAAAINQPPSAPARPETAANDTGGRGGDVNIFWNSPVVTAQTEQELGRSLQGLLGMAEAA